MKEGIKTEEFKTKEERDTRMNELKSNGHHPSKSSDPVPVKWESRWYVHYDPEQRSRK